MPHGARRVVGSDGPCCGLRGLSGGRHLGSTSRRWEVGVGAGDGPLPGVVPAGPGRPRRPPVESRGGTVGTRFPGRSDPARPVRPLSDGVSTGRGRSERRNRHPTGATQAAEKARWIPAAPRRSFRGGSAIPTGTIDKKAGLRIILLGRRDRRGLGKEPAATRAWTATGAARNSRVRAVRAEGHADGAELACGLGALERLQRSMAKDSPKNRLRARGQRTGSWLDTASWAPEAVLKIHTGCSLR